MPTFESHGVHGGIWSGLLKAPAPPGRVCVTHLGEVVAEASLGAGGDGVWTIRAELPATLISEGVRSLTLVACETAPDEAAAMHLGRLNLAAGAVLDDDIAAEIAQIRAELELLKREFRRFAAPD